MKDGVNPLTETLFFRVFLNTFPLWFCYRLDPVSRGAITGGNMSRDKSHSLISEEGLVFVSKRSFEHAGGCEGVLGQFFKAYWLRPV